jgi:transporter family-2 protein
MPELRKAIVMNSYFWLIIIAVVGGVAVALQGQFMGLIDKGIGTRESVFITYASVVTTSSYTGPRLGLSKAFTIIVASQFITAALLDHFGLLGAVMRPLDLSRLLGFGVLILGVWLIMR